ncbi:HK97 family phage prohead protease [Bradyrhizobium sp. USDA 10063]
MTKHWQPGDRINCDLAFAVESQDDLADGFISGTASTPSTDLMGHRVMAHAFDASIRRNGLNGPKGIKLLAQHDVHKPAGMIKRLETVGENLKIDAQLFLDVSYVKDLYTVSKQIGGLSFSVGFELEEFEFVDQKDAQDNEYLIIKQGNLIEVSVVTFPAQPEATMDFIKQLSPDTVAEFEKALVAERLCRSRNEAHAWTVFLKRHAPLFLGKQPPLAAPATQPDRPLLDVQMLKACHDLAARANRALR